MKSKGKITILTVLTFFIVSLVVGIMVKSGDKEVNNQSLLALSNESNINAKNTKSIDDSLITDKVQEDKKQVDVETIASTYKFKSLYGVLVSLDKQKVYIYKGNTLVKTLICSTGLEGSDTPKGTYKIQDRAEYFFSPKFAEGGRYWVRFMGDYLFHSVPTDINKNIIPEEATKLGVKASHGCVRLALDDAKWFYDNVPFGSELVIF
ncbi:MAG: L,D-transpeptidase [Clostridiaceae bacterium]